MNNKTIFFIKLQIHAQMMKMIMKMQEIMQILPMEIIKVARMGATMRRSRSQRHLVAITVIWPRNSWFVKYFVHIVLNSWSICFDLLSIVFVIRYLSSSVPF